jgi:CheY-like chemotaxis protein
MYFSNGPAMMFIDKASFKADTNNQRALLERALFLTSSGRCTDSEGVQMSVILALIEEQDNSLQVRACLEDCGYEVSVARTFVEAITLLNTQEVDLIVSDVHLENGGNIFDFLRVVKKSPRTREIPFVSFSFKPSPTAKYLADGTRTALRYFGASKYIEMETFDFVQFQEQIKGLLTREKHGADASKESELARKVVE